MTKTTGKVAIKETSKTIAKQTGKLASKNAGRVVARNTGKVTIKKAGRAGLKSTLPRNGAIVRYKNIPKSNGHWLGTPGNSRWIPDANRIPKPRNNPLNKNMGRILADNKMSKGVPFRHGEIKFHPASKGTVKIKDFTKYRSKNFAQADSKMAKSWTRQMKDGHAWTKGDVARYRAKNALTWHECPDMKTMELIPRELHANIPHSGGISALKDTLAQSASTISTLR